MENGERAVSRMNEPFLKFVLVECVVLAFFDLIDKEKNTVTNSAASQ